jgi:hypothetical protein
VVGLLFPEIVGNGRRDVCTAGAKSHAARPKFWKWQELSDRVKR